MIVSRIPCDLYDKLLRLYTAENFVPIAGKEILQDSAYHLEPVKYYFWVCLNVLCGYDKGPSC